MKKILVCFAAGCLGALVNSFVVWACGDFGITREFGVSIAPSLTPAWLYPRIVWGGIWGLLFALPLLNAKPFSKGVLMSLFPTFVQLLVVFPMKANKGYFGLDLGLLTPGFVLIFNLVWGLVTSLTLKAAK